MKMPKEYVDLIDIAHWTLEKLVHRMRAKRLTGRALERMKQLEVALQQVELARF